MHTHSNMYVYIYIYMFQQGWTVFISFIASLLSIIDHLFNLSICSCVHLFYLFISLSIDLACILFPRHHVGIVVLGMATKTIAGAASTRITAPRKALEIELRCTLTEYFGVRYHLAWTDTVVLQNSTYLLSQKDMYLVTYTFLLTHPSNQRLGVAYRQFQTFQISSPSMNADNVRFCCVIYLCTNATTYDGSVGLKALGCASDIQAQFTRGNE